MKSRANEGKANRGSKKNIIKTKVNFLNAIDIFCKSCYNEKNKRMGFCSV